MVGGIVVGIRLLTDNTTRIVVGGTDHDRSREMTRLVQGHAKMQLGDCIWWHGNKVMWTPKGIYQKDFSEGQGVKWDIVLERVTS